MFHNPYSLKFMLEAFYIGDIGSFQPKKPYEGTEFYDKLRELQNREWAQDIVAAGIDCAKKGDYKKAMKNYNEALKIDPYNSDAYTAKGAAYVNVNMLEEAVEEFEKALKLNPEHQNARKYLEVTKSKLEEKQRSTEEKLNPPEKKPEQKSPSKFDSVYSQLKSLLKSSKRPDKEVKKHKEKKKDHKKKRGKHKKKKHKKRSKDTSRTSLSNSATKKTVTKTSSSPNFSKRDVKTLESSKKRKHSLDESNEHIKKKFKDNSLHMNK